MPGPVLERLGVRRQRKVRLNLANGQVVEWDLGEVVAEIGGVSATILCVFGEPETMPLIGAHTLEGFLLTVDPVEQCLVPKDALLM